MALTVALPTDTGHPAFDALVAFAPWYPMGTMLVVVASWPLGHLIRERTNRKRQQ
jgi:hypothetical protein